MAKIIVFYIPASYNSKAKYVPVELRGKILVFVPRKGRNFGPDVLRID